MPHKDTESWELREEFSKLARQNAPHLSAKGVDFIVDWWLEKIAVTRTKTLEEVEAVLPGTKDFNEEIIEVMDTDVIVTIEREVKTWNSYRAEALSAIEGLKK